MLTYFKMISNSHLISHPTIRLQILKASQNNHPTVSLIQRTGQVNRLEADPDPVKQTSQFEEKPSIASPS
jgi:hypothetical protein